MGTTAQKLAYTASGVTDAYNAVNEKGGAITSNTPLAQLGGAIRAIPLGGGVVMSPLIVDVSLSTSFTLTHSGAVEYKLTAVYYGVASEFGLVLIDGEREKVFPPGQHTSTINTMIGGPNIQDRVTMITASPSNGSVCLIIRKG